ncbi:MAG: hypothetical protein M3297_06905 [Thermoproteota archaeon]|nr:hypothetical protein [Thermoproteota archaeon]
MRSTDDKYPKLNGITSVEIHIGISDIIADFIYKDFDQILDTISDIKKIQGMEGQYGQKKYIFCH